MGEARAEKLRCTCRHQRLDMVPATTSRRALNPALTGGSASAFSRLSPPSPMTTSGMKMPSAPPAASALPRLAVCQGPATPPVGPQACSASSPSSSAPFAASSASSSLLPLSLLSSSPSGSSPDPLSLPPLSSVPLSLVPAGFTAMAGAAAAVAGAAAASGDDTSCRLCRWEIGGQHANV